MGDLRKVGALWKKEGKNGTFYSGKLDAEAVKSALVGDETRLLLFKTKNPGGKKPDLELFCVPANETRHVRDEDHGHGEPSRATDDGYGDLP